MTDKISNNIMILNIKFKKKEIESLLLLFLFQIHCYYFFPFMAFVIPSFALIAVGLAGSIARIFPQ